MKSYSKKKFFGKVNKDLKMINVRTTYKPRAESLRVMLYGCRDLK